MNLRLAPTILCCLGSAACLAPVPDRPPGFLATQDLYQHLASPETPLAEKSVVPLVVPGASWLEGDLEGFLPERTKFYYDLRGRGRSRPVAARAAFTIESDVADLEVLRAQKGWERIDLMGWAYAGGVAIRYALEHPERVGKLLLISPLPPRYEPYWLQFQERYGRRIDREAIAALDHWRTSGRKSEDPEGYARAYTRITLATFCFDPKDASQARSYPFGTQAPDPERTVRINEGIFHRLGPWALDPLKLAGLELPVLILHGSEDLLPVEASEEYVSRLPQARLEILRNCGRLPWVEDPDTFERLAMSFFASDTGTR